LLGIVHVVVRGPKLETASKVVSTANPNVITDFEIAVFTILATTENGFSLGAF